LIVIPAAIFYLTLAWWIITRVRDDEEADTSEDED